MITPGARRLRLGLGLAMLVLAGLVLANLRRPVPQAAPTSTSPADEASSSQRIEGFEYRGYKGDRESYVLRAERYEGQEQDELRLGVVDLEFSYVSKGKPGTGRIRSDEGTYVPSQERAVFRGNVVLTTEDGLELTCPSLIYRGDRGLARSDDFVEFRRGGLSGSSRGIEYRAADGWLQLRSEAFLRIEGGPGGPATEIRGGRAYVERDDDEIRFADGVEVRRGAETLSARRLLLGFSWEEQRIYRAQAVEQVRLDMPAGGGLPGSNAPSASHGPRLLECSRLELGFRPDRSLEQALAFGKARLTSLPAAGEPAEKRILSADVLSFLFDAPGRLERVVGQRDSGFQVIPLGRQSGSPREVRCQAFTADLDPGSGAVERVEFRQNVVFEQGSRRALAQSATLDARRQLLLLSGRRPRLVERADGSELSARSIELGTLSGSIAARGDVEHALAADPERSGLLAGEGGARLTSRRFVYDPASRTASYSEEARLSSGEDEIRAPEIRLRAEPGGERRLWASGGVVSLLNAAAGADAPAGRGVVEGRAQEMSYDEQSRQIVYSGDVTLTQQDVVTVSPTATLSLASQGRGLLSLVAGEPVEVRQGNRTAVGTRVTYTPASQSMVLVGERVVLRDPGREIRGRTLTLHLGDDRILVDGREEGRIETVFPKEPPKL